MESKVRRAQSLRTKRDVSEPSPLKTPASSTAMYPAPMTPTFLGCTSKSKNPSESITKSSPGTPLSLKGGRVTVKRRNCDRSDCKK